LRVIRWWHVIQVCATQDVAHGADQIQQLVIPDAVIDPVGIPPGGNDVLVIDLREKEQFEKGNIETAISNPFDAFLKSVLVDQKYADYLDKEIVLVCDTGHMSRVAGAILAEEGFKKVYSLSRGMRRWKRWQNMLTQCNNLKYEKNALVASCCCIE